MQKQLKTILTKRSLKYYEVKSKHKPELFYKWGKTFLTLKSPIIIFVEPRHVEMIKLWRNHLPIHIIPLPFNELEMWVNHIQNQKKIIVFPQLSL